jgi:hypothetical protein
MLQLQQHLHGIAQEIRTNERSSFRTRVLTHADGHVEETCGGKLLK